MHDARCDSAKQSMIDFGLDASTRDIASRVRDTGDEF